MIRFLADENLNGKILRGIRRERPDADILRVQDSILYQSADENVLAWAADQARILLTHDIETMVGFANQRIAANRPMSGVIAIRDTLPIGRVIDDLLIILGASEMSDWENIVTFLPL